MNFATHLNDYILVYPIRKYLLREGEDFCITDLGGGLDGRSGTGRMHERILIYYSLLVDA